MSVQDGLAGPNAIPAPDWEGLTAEEWRKRWRLPGLRLYLRVSSTNDIAQRLAAGGAPDGTLVLAESQTRGRGREGREWHATAGAAVLMSLIRRLPAGAQAAGVAPLRVGLAVAVAVERAAAVVARVKWPNDVLDDAGRKLAGVLCEAAFSDAGGTMVVGVGINVNQLAEDWPEQIRPRAASLRMAAGRHVSRPRVLAALLRELDRLTAGDRLVRPFGQAELDELRHRDALLGCEIQTDRAGLATAIGVAPDGALLVRSPEGRELRVLSGSVRVPVRQTPEERRRT